MPNRRSGWKPGPLSLFALFVASLLTLGPVPAPAQGTPGPDAELDALRREVEELRRRDAEKQRRLDELQRRLEELAAPPETRPGTRPGTRPAPGPGEAEDPRSALDRAVGELGEPPPADQPSARDAVLRDAAGRGPLSDLLSGGRAGGGSGLRLIDVSLDVLAAGGGSTEPDSSLQTLQGGGHDPRKNGFTLQNVELSLAGAVDPYLYGEAHLIYFIDPIEGESVFELEEAFLTTQQLPFGLQVKAGQYFTEFGRINPRHPHQWEWMDLPVINARLFGPDGMRAPGARVAWLTPLPWHSELFVGAQNANGETMASFLASDEFFEERPVGGRPFAEQDSNAFNGLVYSLRWENGFDISREWSAAVGLSALFGPNATGPDGDTRIYGTDVTLKWRPVRHNRGSPYFLSQTEVMYRDYDADDAQTEDGEAVAGDDLEDWGFYTQALYSWEPRWRGGVRFEYASGSGESVGGRDNDPFRDDRFRVSPLLEFLPSEFSRVRLQYNYDVADHLEDDDAHSVWLGFEYLLGAHPPHRF